MAWYKKLDILKGDRVIWVSIIGLFVLSIIEVYSSTSLMSWDKKGGDTTYYAIRHLSFVVAGLVCMFIGSFISYKRLYKWADIMLYVSVFMLFLTLFFAPETNDARRWLTIPFINISFQTSDMAKLCLTIYLAKNISIAHMEKGKTKECFFKCVAAIVGVCGLILPANFSTALLIGGTSLIILLLAQFPYKWTLSLIPIALIGFLLYVLVADRFSSHSRVSTWTKRIETYFSKNNDEKYNDSNYQTTQAYAAIALGGFTGKGIGGSQQRNALPHPYSDYIYAILNEELGLIGTLAPIIAYALIFIRCIVIVKNSDRMFPAFLVLGLCFNIVFQALSNMLVAVGILPVTGQPLPFVSMGGTSVIFASIGVGILLNISRYSLKREDVAEVEKYYEEEEEITDYPFMAG